MKLPTKIVYVKRNAERDSQRASVAARMALVAPNATTAHYFHRLARFWWDATNRSN